MGMDIFWNHTLYFAMVTFHTKILNSTEFNIIAQPTRNLFKRNDLDNKIRNVNVNLQLMCFRNTI